MSTDLCSCNGHQTSVIVTDLLCGASILQQEEDIYKVLKICDTTQTLTMKEVFYRFKVDAKFSSSN